MVGWQDMIAKIIPVHSRGKFFGLSNFLREFHRHPGSIRSFLAAAAFRLSKRICRLIRHRGPVHSRFPGYSLAAAVTGAYLSSKPVVSHQDYFKSLPATIRANPNFQRYLDYLDRLYFWIDGIRLDPGVCY